jgi:hypothetical protein
MAEKKRLQEAVEGDGLVGGSSTARREEVELGKRRVANGDKVAELKIL